jgi:hypothetical protein
MENNVVEYTYTKKQKGNAQIEGLFGMTVIVTGLSTCVLP